MQYKAIYLERQEREFFKTQFLEYRIVETCEKEFRVVAQDASIHRLKLTRFLHPVQDMFVVIKPVGDLAKDSEPLAKLRVLMKQSFPARNTEFMTIKSSSTICRSITRSTLRGLITLASVCRLPSRARLTWWWLRGWAIY